MRIKRHLYLIVNLIFEFNLEFVIQLPKLSFYDHEVFGLTSGTLHQKRWYYLSYIHFSKNFVFPHQLPSILL